MPAPDRGGGRMGQAVRAQQEAGVGRRRESMAISLEVLQEKVAPLDFAALAEGLGAAYGEEAGRPYLSLTYFGHPLQVFKDELRYPPGARPTPGTPSCCTITSPPRARSRWRAGGSPITACPTRCPRPRPWPAWRRSWRTTSPARPPGSNSGSTNWGAKWWRWARTPTSRPLSAAAQSAPAAAVLGRRGRGRLRPPGPLAVRRQRHPLPGPGSHALPGGTPDGEADGELDVMTKS